MSDIPRYRPVSNDRYGITDDVDGKLCEYRDYARLKAEVERLRNLGIKLDGYVDLLQGENERLRKAGDALHKSMLECGPNEMAEEFDHDRWWASYYAWNAAKEGKGQP